MVKLAEIEKRLCGLEGQVSKTPSDPDEQRYAITNKILWGVFLLILVFFLVSVGINLWLTLLDKKTFFDVKDIVSLILSSITSIIGFVIGYYFKDK